MVRNVSGALVDLDCLVVRVKQLYLIFGTVLCRVSKDFWKCCHVAHCFLKIG